jgi:hypothetical protein
VCFERVPVLQAAANFPEVIDFAVKDEGDIAGFVRERLISGLKVNDAESADGQRYVGQFELAVAVRAAMHKAGGHLIDSLASGHRFEFQIEETANAAHGKSVTRDE